MKNEKIFRQIYSSKSSNSPHQHDSIPQTINEGEEFVSEKASPQESQIPESSRKPPVRIRTSPVWAYFDLINETAICKLCKSPFSHRLNSGTCTLRRHLDGTHKNWETNDLLDDSIQQNLEILPSGTISNYTYKHDELRDEIAKMVIGAELPFNFVQNPFLIE